MGVAMIVPMRTWSSFSQRAAAAVTRSREAEFCARFHTGKPAQAQALMNTCSQLRQQISHHIKHAVFGVGGSSLGAAVQTFVRSWPRHAGVTSILFEPEGRRPCGLSALGRYEPAPFRMDRLEKVAFSSGCRITQADMFALAACCSALKHLDIGAAEIDWDDSPLAAGDGRFLQPLAHMPSLTTLHLITPEYTTSMDEPSDRSHFLNSLQHLPNSLTRVHLRWSPTVEIPLVGSMQDALQFSCSIPGLRLLHLPYELDPQPPGGNIDYAPSAPPSAWRSCAGVQTPAFPKPCPRTRCPPSSTALICATSSSPSPSRAQKPSAWCPACRCWRPCTSACWTSPQPRTSPCGGSGRCGSQ